MSELRPEFSVLCVNSPVAALRGAFSKISPPSGARAREYLGELPSWEGARPWVSVGWGPGEALIRAVTFYISAK